MNGLALRLLDALPQTQCTRCGYDDCAAYAEAITAQQAEINQCPPGGAEGVARLAALSGMPALPLNPVHGVEAPRTLAFIDEQWCIGCTLCVKACPTDAIVGGNKQMHTVIEAYCTGCELCIPVCPVDCIELENASGQTTGWSAWSASQASEARQRYALRTARLQRQNEANDLPTGGVANAVDALSAADPLHLLLDVAPTTSHPASPADARRAAVQAAMTRARAQRGK